MTRGGHEIDLTPTEFAILAVLMRHVGRVVTRTRLAESVWQGEASFNVIDVHVTHLRRKVDEGHPVKLIHTVRGVGFILREEVPK